MVTPGPRDARDTWLGVRTGAPERDQCPGAAGGKGPAGTVTLKVLRGELSWQTHRRRGAFRTELLGAQVQPSQAGCGFQGSLLL